MTVARVLGARAQVAMPQASIASRFVLQGVVAVAPGGGAALIAVDGKPARPFRVGSAVEEGWSIEWNEHKRIFQSAKTALTERRYIDSLCDFARAIHILMVGIHLLRRQRDQMLRWGTRAPAKEEEEPEAPEGK